MREPLFILSPPRSFSSLISSMIGQHPELHAFPELQIFSDETIGDMMEKNQRRFNRLSSAGSIRSIAEVHEHQQTDESCARAWLWLQKRSAWSPSDFFDYLRKKIDPQIAVEKTPVNTWKASRLETIIRTYPNAKFLHLSRSVNGNSSSLKEFIKDQDKLLGRQETDQLTGRALSREYPASVWYICHRNILSMKPLIKEDNFIQIKGEDLLNHPSAVLIQFCRWMNIDASPTSINAMLRPHESPYAFVGPKIAIGGNDGKFMRQPVLTLKNTTQQKKSPKAFKEDAKKSYYELDFDKFFKQYKSLSSHELQQVSRWCAQLSKEIHAMQLRLGY